MQIGRRNRKVTIQRLTSGQDDIGQPVQTWSDLATVWANVKTLTGSEAIKGGAETSTAKASIRIRRRTDVTAAMRVLYGTTAYQIKAVLPNEEDRKDVDLVCEIIV